jgi:pyruvate/2-oxoglutarate dehydrogenase complex dihydrolipoamide dehydrogenase (E3) component
MSGTAFRRPRRFDANLVVIGAGSAGLVSAYVAAAARATVVLIEAERMGGDCLNTGCVPSKALIRSARAAAQLRRAPEFGLRAVTAEADFPRVMGRVHEIIGRIAPHDSVERYAALGVDCVSGRATLRSPWEVEVGGRVITTRAIVIATGGRPVVPPIPGLAAIEYLTSDNLWALRELPRRLAVLGGGAVGCELAQAFGRLGSEVTLVEMRPRLLSREDPEADELLQRRFAAESMDVCAGWQATAVRASGAAGHLDITRDGVTRTISFDRILVATGRRANTDGLGLEQVGVSLDSNGTVRVNEYLQTDVPSIYACGDVAGPYQLTHAAAHQAWYCATNALFGSFRRFRVNYGALPWAVFTEPEVARVGLNETEARERGVSFEVTRYGLEDLDRAIADGSAEGFVKVLTRPGSDRILGVTVVGPHAGETIAEFVLAMRHGLGLRKMLGTIHSYPTLTEANRLAAGAWQRAHLPGRLLDLAAWYHRWRRR